jgi:hypothetical protein
MKIDPPRKKIWLIIIVEDPKGGPWSHFLTLSGQAPDRGEWSKVTICMPLFENLHLPNPWSQKRQICAILLATELPKWWAQICAHAPAPRDAVAPFVKIRVSPIRFFPRSFFEETFNREKHTPVFRDRSHPSMCQRARWFIDQFSLEVRWNTSKSPYFCLVPHIHGHFSRTRAKFKISSDRIVDMPLEQLQVHFQANLFTPLRSLGILLNPSLTFFGISGT